MKDPYATGMFADNPYYDKPDLSARAVVVLQGKYEDRGLTLIKPKSRCIKQYDIHELIITDEVDAGPGKEVNHIAYMGFVEALTGGVIIIGDEVLLNGTVVGTIAGFDETHMPNHQNIVIKSDKRLTGVELGLKVSDSIIFRMTKQ